MNSFFTKKNLALQVVFSALIVVGLAAGVTIVSNKNAEVGQSHAQGSAPKDCSLDRTSCGSGMSCKFDNSQQNYGTYGCLDNKCPGFSRTVCTGTKIYLCGSNGQYRYTGQDCGGHGCCGDGHGGATCCDNVQKPTPLPNCLPLGAECGGTGFNTCCNSGIGGSVVCAGGVGGGMGSNLPVAKCVKRSTASSCTARGNDCVDVKCCNGLECDPYNGANPSDVACEPIGTFSGSACSTGNCMNDCLCMGNAASYCGSKCTTPTSKPIACSGSGGSCIDPHYCCSGFDCNSSNICVAPASKPAPTPTKTTSPTYPPTAPPCGKTGQPACVQ